MDRIVKFRVWDKKRRKFDYGNVEAFYPLLLDGSDNLIPDQCIGRTDTSGQQIFEGDIVQYTERLHEHGDCQKLVAVVQYDEKAAAFGVGCRKELWNYFSDMTVSSFEVQGNIYEHPDKAKHLGF